MAGSVPVAIKVAKPIPKTVVFPLLTRIGPDKLY